MLFAQIMYRYELAEECRGMTSTEELMKLTCHNDDIVKFRNDFKSLWESLDPQLKASIGKVALRDFIYKQLKNSKKLEKQMKDYEQVNKYDTPRKYARIRLLPWLWKQITDWEEKERRKTNAHAVSQGILSGAEGFYAPNQKQKSTMPAAAGYVFGGKGKGKGRGRSRKNKWPKGEPSAPGGEPKSGANKTH